MEFMEIPTIPKGVLDSFLASIGSSEMIKEVTPHSRQNNGCGLLPGAPLHGATMRPPAALHKTSSGSLPPLPGRRELCGIPPGSLFKDNHDSYLAGGSVGPLPPVNEKPKRTRKSRAGSTPKRKGISDLVLDANLEGNEQSLQVSPPKRRRASVKSEGNAAEKPPPRKRNRSKAKSKDKHTLSASTIENSFSQSDPTSSKGILGVYGLETKALDLTQYMKDITVEGLLAGNFDMPSLPRKPVPPSSSMVDSSFGKHVSSILQNLTRSSSLDQPRATSLFSKPAESKPPKFLFDLESTPLDGIEESFGGNMLDNRIRAAGLAPISSTQNRKTQDGPSVFSLETVPIIPPADFWNTLQIQPTMPLNSLISQASSSLDSRFFPSEVGSSSCEKSSTLPPSIFSLGLAQVPQESACDRLASSKLNHWFRAESPKQDFPDILSVRSQESKFPFKLEGERNVPSKPTEKLGAKEGYFDIDLNKQSEEAEAAESVVHSSSIVFSQLEVGNALPVAIEARIDTDNMDEGTLHDCKGSDMEICAPVKESDATSNIDLAEGGEVAGHVLNKGQSVLQDGEATERPSEESCSAFVKGNLSVEPMKNVSAHVLTCKPTLLLPDAPEAQEMCSDVPYSPGMQATARLLCRMAISSSPFYAEKDDKNDEHAHAHALASGSWNVAAFEPPAKAVKVRGSVGRDGRVHKTPAPQKSRDKEYTHKVYAKDAKEKSLYSQMVSSSVVAADKASGSEPWASTPPRHAPKNVASRVTGSQSSESDRSPCNGPREYTSNANHGNTNKVQREHHAGASTFSSSLTRKDSRDSKGHHTPVLKTTSIHALPAVKGAASTQRKSVACETKRSLSSIHGEGFTKISRPRSNSSKNCLQAQRTSTNGFPVQLRNPNGCSIKSPSSRHVLPYVGEVRHGSK